MRKINTTRSSLLACVAVFKVPSPQVAIVKALNIALVPSSGNQKYHTHKYAYLYLHRTQYLLECSEPSVLLCDYDVRRHILLLVRRCLGFPYDSALKEPTCQCRRQVQFPGQEDPLEKEMATHSSILASTIPRTEVPGGLQSMGSQRVRQDRSN